MFSVHAIMVPTVALTPSPDQAEANWLLRVTFLSLSLPPPTSLFVSLCLSLSGVHLDIQRQCNVISCPRMAVSL